MAPKCLLLACKEVHGLGDARPLSLSCSFSSAQHVAIAMYTLRKSQSLKSLTENPEGSWVRPSNALSRGRKSVLQLVQQ
ncbi:hypothetical protein CRUP_016687 [Coryphaenoides rupestris]|nr:hypothetical protein CRUP_016687 [Coryphaenoides rupestris]